MDEPNSVAIPVEADEIEAKIRSLIRELVETENENKELTLERDAFLRKTYLDIIQVCDSFERLFKILDARKADLSPDTKKITNNFKTIHRLLEKVLKDRQVLVIQTESPYFDPHWHQVAEVVEDPTKEDGIIVEEVTKGYLWKDYVLREAMVKIVKNS